jgi:hypothetical protein
MLFPERGWKRVFQAEKSDHLFFCPAFFKRWLHGGLLGALPCLYGFVGE